MQLLDYADESEVGRGVAREDIRQQIDDLKGILSRYWVVEAFEALHKQLPGAARITMHIEENADGTSAVDVRTVYDTDGKLIWADRAIVDDEIESTVTDFLAAAHEHGAFDLTTGKTAHDGASEVVLADQYTAALAPRAQVMAGLKIRTYPADEQYDGDFRTVLEVRGVTIDVRIRRAMPDGTTLYTEIDLDPADVPTDRRPVCVTTDFWTTDLHTFA